MFFSIRPARLREALGGALTYSHLCPSIILGNS